MTKDLKTLRCKVFLRLAYARRFFATLRMTRWRYFHKHLFIALKKTAEAVFFSILFVLATLSCRQRSLLRRALQGESTTFPQDRMFRDV